MLVINMEIKFTGMDSIIIDKTFINLINVSNK